MEDFVVRDMILIPGLHSRFQKKLNVKNEFELRNGELHQFLGGTARTGAVKMWTGRKR